MVTLIDQYINYKRQAWSHSTLTSERSRLVSVAAYLNGDPQALFNATSHLGSYTRQTLFIRVAALWDWLISEGLKPGPNPYKQWRSKNANLFKGAYKRREVGITYDQAKEAIEKIKDPAVRNRAIQILCNGLRWHESTQQENIANGKVIGKGNKLRAVYGRQVEGPNYQGCYTTFRKRLAEVGLKPHDLRKLFATKLVENGLKEADLLKVMGWNSILTAQVYLQPKNDSELKSIIGDL